MRTHDQWDKIHFESLKAPKFGNDDPYADAIIREWENWFCGMLQLQVTLRQPMYACQISVSTHGPMGSATLATADGRLSGTTFSDASVSAFPGTDREAVRAIELGHGLGPRHAATPSST